MISLAALAVAVAVAAQAAPRVAMADLKPCWRPLDWNAARQTFVYAPLAEARPLSNR